MGEDFDASNILIKIQEEELTPVTSQKVIKTVN
jgi:hypothetical protein